MGKRIMVLFKIKKQQETSINSFDFIGVIRGLGKCGYGISVGGGSIEDLSNKDHYAFVVMIDPACFEMAKGQAGSYGVSIEKVIDYFHASKIMEKP